MPPGGIWAFCCLTTSPTWPIALNYHNDRPRPPQKNRIQLFSDGPACGYLDHYVALLGLQLASPELHLERSDYL
ncbi:hypothetical protein GY45DRAFT_1324798 [Cubamyces sp. BRFM 1775]|nr:hypothetical protein GY45DRAFT_1324798 [Cubamyces sp. BRFM 1775]